MDGEARSYKVVKTALPAEFEIKRSPLKTRESVFSLKLRRKQLAYDFELKVKNAHKEPWFILEENFILLSESVVCSKHIEHFITLRTHLLFMN